jgi:membrane protease YdiL (CAAX protease family)
MTTILTYLSDYWKGLNKAQFAFVSLFTAAAIWLNYKYDIEDSWIDRHYGTYKHFIYYYLLYSVAVIAGYLSYLHDSESRKSFLSNPRFWGRLALAVGIFSFYCYFYQYRDWLNHQVNDAVYRAFLKACADQVVQSSLMFLLVLGFWWWRDRKEQPLYGFRMKGVNIQPYLWLLSGMIPLVVAAGFFSQFTDYYPTARKILYYSEQLKPFPLYLLAYELCYGSEFFHIEFFFRGFLILAFAKYVGIKSVLPVAVFYCFVHFGKPPGECISSYFGGIILGVLSYRTKSIAAGVMIHVGIAWLMELVAGGWYYFNEYLQIHV